jgi:hypothetical protein
VMRRNRWARDECPAHDRENKNVPCHRIPQRMTERIKNALSSDTPRSSATGLTAAGTEHTPVALSSHARDLLRPCKGVVRSVGNRDHNRRSARLARSAAKRRIRYDIIAPR